MKRKIYINIWCGCFIFLVLTAGCQRNTVEEVSNPRGCLSYGTLERLIECIEQKMPGEDEGYRPPTRVQRDDLYTVMLQMLEQETNISLPASLEGIMQVVVFRDTENRQDYTLLMEIGDTDNNGVVDRGFGTFIVNNNAERELNIAAPHVLYEPNTRTQAIKIFKASGARSFIMAGAHRYADSDESDCQPDYPISDAAHNVRHMFFVATKVLMTFYNTYPWYQLQFHGYDADICPDANVNISHGNYRVKPSRHSVITRLRDNLQVHNPTWMIAIDGEDCSYDGGNNTSGRLLNGIPEDLVCFTDAKKFGPTFIHIEQHAAYRAFEDWVDAIIDTFPPEPIH